MEKFSYINNANGAFVEDLYKRYKENPSSIDKSWQKFFEGYEFASLAQNGNANHSPTTVETPQSMKEANVVKLISAYRTRGHLIAKTNPIRERRKHRVDFDLEYFGLEEADLELSFEVAKELGLPKSKLKDIITYLKKTYCSHIGAEFRQIRDERIRQWLYKEMEPIANDPKFSINEKKHILEKINQAVTFENFLHTKYVGKKRFSLEGGEALIPAMDALIELGSELGAQEFVLGMAHRGRLNILVNIFQKSYEQVFAEFEGSSLPDDVLGDGDVKYHLGRSADIVAKNGKNVHLSLTANPSHLEAVNPVVEGIVRGKVEQLYDMDYQKIVPVLIHGDAAIAGQGIVYETANFSKLEGYDTGGTIHIIINNQVGFTANYKETRTSIYCTDIAKILEAPVFHVNGDDPEAVVHAMQMAIKLRQTFHCDVFVDILCYRRYGHNEGDEPKFTQPILYNLISGHDNIHKLYLEELVKNGDLSKGEAIQETVNLKKQLQGKLDEAKKERKNIEVDFFGRNWKGLRIAKEADFVKRVNTKIKKTDLDRIVKALVTVPGDFNLFSKMKRLLNAREKMYFTEKKVDWGLAELMGYGSLLIEGHPVRLSGQDCRRGTFSHRHSVILDVKNETEYYPLNNITDKQAEYQVYNSLLSEYGVLGFEYGYSLAMPNSLVIWEAQFGDFANGAQIIFDQFISASESKWQRMSGLVILLPHGYEGQGPEHSSARLERFLQLCGQNNMYVTNITSPANFFHMLRRQLHQDFRKPLINMSPKSLLRHPEVLSDVKDFTNGDFQEVIYDDSVNDSSVKKVLLCSGKVYFDLNKERNKLKNKDIAIVRLEQLYPIHDEKIKEILSKYKSAKKWVWVQEEPENMGAWSYLFRTFYNHKVLSFVGRRESASPATGSSEIHEKQQNELIDKAFKI